MLNVSCGVFNTAPWRRDWTQSAVVSIHPNTLNVCARKKKRNKRSPFNDTACNCAYNVKKRNLCQCLKTPLPWITDSLLFVQVQRDHGRSHIEGKTCCTYMDTVWPWAASESISVNVLHGNAVAAADQCGVSCLCSAVKKKERRKKKPSALTNQCATKSDLR